MPYTPEQQQMIIKLWDGGKSDSQISEAFFIKFGIRKSRNAIIGWRNRNKDKFLRKDTPSSRKQANRYGARRLQSRRQARPNPPVVRPKPAPVPAPASAPRKIVRAEDYERGFEVSLMDIKAGQCRFPVSGEGMDLLFCGAPCAPASNISRTRRSYCTLHGDVAAPASEQRRFKRQTSVKILEHKGAFDG